MLPSDVIESFETIAYLMFVIDERNLDLAPEIKLGKYRLEK